MLWTPTKTYTIEPFEREKDLETAIVEARHTLFGSARIYLDLKRKIGIYGKRQNMPDGYLLDLTSKKEPKLYFVENELAAHDPLNHIAVQILQFSLSFEMSPQRVKQIIKDGLAAEPASWEQCAQYAATNGYENIDYLLEQMLYQRDAFNALVIIDEMPDELEKVLHDRFKFPVEIITFQRYRSPNGDRIYQFEPFLYDVTETEPSPAKTAVTPLRTIDPSEINTVVVPARDEGFQETFLGQDCWRAIRIHSSMINKIKYLATYRVAPISAITHIAEVRDIQPWRDTNKYILYFTEPAQELPKPIKLIPKGRVKAPQAPRYTSLAQLQSAETLDDAF